MDVHIEEFDSSNGVAAFMGASMFGTRVMGVCDENDLSTKKDPMNLFTVPCAWDACHALDFVKSYALAYVSLFVKASLKTKQTLLIHGGHTRVAKAIIDLALLMNCKLIVTVPNKEEKEKLEYYFPKQIKKVYVTTSDDTVHDLKKFMDIETIGCGVDVTLITDDRITIPLECIQTTSTNGHIVFIEHVPKQAVKFTSSISIHTIFLRDILYTNKWVEIRKQMDNLLRTRSIKYYNI